MCTSGIFRSVLQITALMKYFKHIEPSKEERIQSVLPKPDCPLAHLMLTLLRTTIWKLLIASAADKTKQSLVGGYLCMHS